MADAPIPSPELIKDVGFALHHRRACALGLRNALLTQYEGEEWTKDRLLGPPFDLGFEDRAESLGQCVDRVVSAGGSSRHLERVRHAGAEFDHLAVSYKGGLVAGSTVRTWRADVKRVHGKLVSALAAAEAWLAAWGRVARSRPPELALLEQQELLGTEDLARVLGVGEEAAARRRRRGEFREGVGRGRRRFVKSSNVRKALGLSPPPEKGD